MKVRVIVEGVVQDYNGYPPYLELVKDLVSKSLPGGFSVVSIEKVKEENLALENLRDLYSWIPKSGLWKSLIKQDRQRLQKSLWQMASHFGIDPRELDWESHHSWSKKP